jgi:WD40 repeat protein
MGVVYRARQKSLKRLVALKMILSGAFADLEDRTRFQSEAAAVARLQHANIIQVYEVGLAEGRPYFSMEYAQGGSLAERLRGTPLPAREAALLLEPLARGMYFAHQQGVIHRDLKPGNILLIPPAALPDAGRTQELPISSSDSGTALGTPKVTDFGLAKLLDEQSGQTRTNAILGTPSYMAPEQAAGHAREVGPVTDVYSLGAILYELLTGRPPFRGESVPDTLDQVRHQEPVPPRRLQPKVPRDLETICLKCLQKEPARRYETAAALAGDLHRFLIGEPILARRTGGIEKLWRWCRRQPLVASLLAALALVIIAAFVLVTAKGLAEARANQAAQEARQRAEEARHEAEHISARALLDGAISQADGGDVDRALLMLVQGLELAERSDDTDLQRVFRMNLTGWQSRLFRMRARLRHGDWAWDVAYSPDGRHIATASADKMVRRWEAATGQLIGEPLRHEYGVWSVTYSPDGRTLLTGSGDLKSTKGGAQLWDAATGKPLGPPFWRGSSIGQVAFRADGRRILTAGPEQARIWKAAGDQPIGAPKEAGEPLPALTSLTLTHPGELEAALFSPDGKLVLTGGKDGTARLWQMDTGRPFGPPLRHGTSDSKRRIQVAAAAFSPDGQLVVTGSQVIDLVAKRHVGGEAQLWRVATGKPVGPLWPHRGSLKAITFSRDGQRVMTGGIVAEGHPKGKYGGEARLWDIATGKPIGPPMEQAEPVWAVAISPDGRTLLTGCEDDHIQFWSAATALPLGKAYNLDLGNAVAVAFSPDGRTALAGHATGDAHANLFEVPPGRGIALSPWHRRPLLALAFSPDGRLLLSSSGDRSIRLWDVATGQPRGTPWATDLYVDGIAFSSDGRLAATACTDGKVCLWDVAHGQRSDLLLPQPIPAYVAAFSPDNRLLVVVYPDDGMARLWDVVSGKPLGPALRQRGVRTAHFSPDGQSVWLGGGDIAAQAWDVTTGQPLGSPLQTSIPAVTLAFSPDGRRLLMTRQAPRPETIGSAARDAAQTWLVDRATGEVLVPPLQQRDGVAGAAFSPDGQIIATVARGGSLMLWDAATGRRLGPVLQHPRWVTALAFHPHGTWLATGCEDGIIRFWDVPAPATGDSAWIKQWVRMRTGCDLTAEGLMPALDPQEIATLRRELESAGAEPFPLPASAKP